MKRNLCLLCLFLAGLLLIGCRGQREIDMTDPADAEKRPAEYAEGQELLCFCASEEAAETVAAQYGIELVSFCEGVAVFHTEEEPESVIRRGQEQGLPELSLNRVVHAAR